MTNIQRVKRVLLALLMILCACVMIAYPKQGFYIVAVIVSVSLIIYGIRTLIYYLTMARHMVGGKTILYIGIIVLDFGVLIITTVEEPRLFIVIYLLAVHGFSGAMSMLQAFEEKRFESSTWKWTFAEGFANLVVAILAVIAGVFLRSMEDLSYLYAACLLYSACTQIATAFRKTSIVYIQ